MMERFRDAYKGQAVWIVGKGPSLQYLTSAHIGPGPVITINEALIKIEELDLPNPIFAMMKDGGERRQHINSYPLILKPDCDHKSNCGDVCGNIVRPKRGATLLVHKHESLYCFADYSPRYVFDWRKLGLHCNQFSQIIAIKIGLIMGCIKFCFISFDAHVSGCLESYIPNVGVVKTKNEFRNHRQRVRRHLRNLNHLWITPEEKLTRRDNIMVKSVDLNKEKLKLKHVTTRGIDAGVQVEPPKEPIKLRNVSTIILPDIADITGRKMRTITRLWKNLYVGLGQINPECPSENEIVRQTMKPSKYRELADMIIKEFNPQDSILEIGCAFGGLAHEILKEKEVPYTVVDNKIMLAQAKRLLGDKVEYIEADFIETLHDRKFGLFIAHWCLSETPAEYREYILEHIIKNCQKISIMDFQDEQIPSPAMISNGYEITPLRIEEWMGRYFIIKKTLLSKRHFNQYLYIGESRKEA